VGENFLLDAFSAINQSTTNGWRRIAHKGFVVLSNAELRALSSMTFAQPHHATRHESRRRRYLTQPTAMTTPPTLRFPTARLRFAFFALLWVFAAIFCYSNYVTDACPPEVERREALLHGLLAPLSLAAASSSAPCVHTVGLRPYVGLGFLIAWILSTIFMLRGRTLTSFSLSTAAMIGLYLVGGSCLIYMNEHGYS
jgi:hypothetical protein